VNCPNCGAPASAAQRFCEVCGHLLEQIPRRLPPGTPASVPNAQQDPARGTATLPGTPILLGDGEIIWRQYRAAQLSTRQRGEGTLYVTNCRVVFYARARGRGTQRSSTLVQQTKLEHITGLAAYVSRKVSLALFLFTLWWGLGTLVALLSRHWLSVLIGAALTAVCVVLLRRSAATRGSVGVLIHSGATQASPIGFGQFGEQPGLLGSLFRGLLQPLLALFGVHTAFDVLVGFPGQDSDQIIAELGALIFDLQTQGDLAGTHWGVTTGAAGHAWAGDRP
jgi:hypothetical protein